MQSLTSAPSTAPTRAPIRRVLFAVLLALALGLWLTVTAGPATSTDAEPWASHSWVG